MLISMACRAILGCCEHKNEKFFKNVLDVSGGFMYTLPRTPLRGGSKEKAKVSESPSRLSRARQFSMHGLSEASGPQRCGTNGKPTMRDAGEAKEREEKGRDACRGHLRRRSSEELPSGVIHGTGESERFIGPAIS